MEIRHHTVRANGIRQHYLDAGHGPPSSFFMAFLKQIMHGGTRFRRSRHVIG
jgi:hypothetical protein